MAYTGLVVSFTAIRTSSSMPVHLIYNICARQEYIEPLREETESMLRGEGGHYTRTGINKLTKLDNFIAGSLSQRAL